MPWMECGCLLRVECGRRDECLGGTLGIPPSRLLGIPSNACAETILSLYCGREKSLDQIVVVRTGHPSARL